MTEVLTGTDARADSEPDPPALRALREAALEHALWQARLLRCLPAGWLKPRDLQFILPLYLAAAEAYPCCYSVLKALGAEDPSLRQAGDADPIRARIAALRLVAGQGPADAEAAGPKVPTFLRYFIQQCVRFCLDGDPAEALGFLFGVEQIIERLKPLFIKAREKEDAAWAPPEAPARAGGPTALLGALASRAGDRGSAERCRRGLDRAMDLHLGFMDELYQAMVSERVRLDFDRIQARKSQKKEADTPFAIRPGMGEIMCVGDDEERGAKFFVERYPVEAAVLDPRLVRIPAGKTNNRHRHAHETLFCFYEGTGQILVEDTWVQVEPGDAVFVPRWALHQTQNTGSTELVMLAITDYYLTYDVYVGAYDKI